MGKIINHNRKRSLFFSCVISIVILILVNGIFVSIPIADAGVEIISMIRVAGPRDPRESGTTLVNNDGPNIIVNTGDGSEITVMNNITLKLNISVEDSDEVYNDTFENGTKIASVTVNLIAFGRSETQAMDYEDNASLPNSNSTRMEGWYVYDLNLNGIPAGNYLVNFTATDSGNNTTGVMAKSTTVSFTIKIGQYNRAPTVVSPGTFTYTTYEDDDWGIDFWVNETVFTDADVQDGPFPNTVDDDLTFTLWNPEFLAWTVYYSAENFTCGFNLFDMNMFLIYADNPDMYTLPAGEKVLLNATDASGESVTKEITIIITPENDDPVMEGMATQDEDNAIISADGFTITTRQGNFVNISVNASEVDITDTLTYAIVDESFDTTTTALTDVPFDIDTVTGAINFTPTNDAVGSFVVNLSITDNVITTPIEANFTFVVENANDPPAISTINTVAPTNHAIALTAKQDTEFTAQVVATDLDIDRDLGDELTFAADSTKLTITMVDNTTANFTLTPANADVGELVVNITVTDTIAEVTDYVVVTITITDVNDPPIITDVVKDSLHANVVNKIADFSLPPLTQDAPNMTFTIKVTDIDFDVDINETLLWSETSNRIPTTAYNFLLTDENRIADITIIGSTLLNGKYEYNFTVKDRGGLSDYLIVKVEVNFSKHYYEPTTPKVILKTNDPKIAPGEILRIEGTVDYDGSPMENLILKIRITNGEIELIYETEVPIIDGKFSYDFEVPDNINGNSTKGLWTISAWVTDGDLESAPATTSLIIDEEPKPEDNNKDDDSVSGMGTSMDLIIISVGIIILIILIILVIIIIYYTGVVKKKGKTDQKRVLPVLEPDEYYHEDSSSKIYTKVQCPSCGAKIPTNVNECPYCGAPPWYY